MQNALPCDKPHKGGRDSTVHIQTGPQTAPSAPKSMQQRDAGHAPRVLPSSAAQLPVDAALNAHGLTLLMVLLYAFFRPIATTTPIIFPNSRGRFLAGVHNSGPTQKTLRCVSSRRALGYKWSGQLLHIGQLSQLVEDLGVVIHAAELVRTLTTGVEVHHGTGVGVGGVIHTGLG